MPLKRTTAPQDRAYSTCAESENDAAHQELAELFEKMRQSSNERRKKKRDAFENNFKKDLDGTVRVKTGALGKMQAEQAKTQGEVVVRVRGVVERRREVMERIEEIVGEVKGVTERMGRVVGRAVRGESVLEEGESERPGGFKVEGGKGSERIVLD